MNRFRKSLWWRPKMLDHSWLPSRLTRWSASKRYPKVQIATPHEHFIFGAHVLLLHSYSNLIQIIGQARWPSQGLLDNFGQSLQDVVQHWHAAMGRTGRAWGQSGAGKEGEKRCEPGCEFVDQDGARCPDGVGEHTGEAYSIGDACGRSCVHT